MLRVYDVSDGARCCLRVDFEPLADAMFSSSVQPAFPFALWRYAKGVRAHARVEAAHGTVFSEATHRSAPR